MASIELQDTGFKPKATKMHCDKPLYPGGLAEPLPQCHGFLYQILGSSGSGKSSYMHSLFDPVHIRGKKADFVGIFDQIFYVGPSSKSVVNNQFDDIAQDHKFPDLESFLVNYDDVRADDIEEQRKEEKALHDKAVEKALAQGKKSPKRPPPGDVFTLVIMDDVGAELKDGRLEKSFNQLIHNRRHKNISIIVLNQDYVQVPKQIRKSLNYMAAFAPKVDELDELFKKLGVPRKLYNEFLDLAYQERYDFVYADFTRGIPRLYRNQDSPLIIKR